MSPTDLALIEPNLKEIVMVQGTLLQEQGEQINHIYFPHTGMISLLAVMHNGNSIETATVGREGAVGGMSGFGGRHAFTRAIVQADGTASRISVTKFQEATSKSPGLRQTIVRFNEGLLAQVQQTAACNALHELDERLCRWLLQTQDRVGGNLITLTHEFLSQMLAVRRTTVTLVARGLQKDGIIHTGAARSKSSTARSSRNALASAMAWSAARSQSTCLAPSSERIRLRPASELAPAAAPGFHRAVFVTI